MQDSKLTVESTECFEVVLTRGERDDNESFQPLYAPFFEDETIFGYSDLSIRLWFGAASLRQCLDVQYTRKHNKADDIEGALFEYLSKDYAKDSTAFLDTVKRDEDAFTPHGSRVASYVIDSKGKGTSGPAFRFLDATTPPNDEEAVYEAYSADWTTKGFIDWHRRMRIFNTLLIDGASDIDEDDPAWSFVTLWRKKDGYSFVGFVSLYSFFYYSPSLLERRQKLAQFFILPPFQGQGHGAALYTVCRRQALQDETIVEFTVEDPSDAFEDLRDKVDLAMLREASPNWHAASLSDSRAQLEALRRELKLATRQFYRLLEMKTLAKLDEHDPDHTSSNATKGKGKATTNGDASHERDLKSFRLAVKKRLYLFNKDTLDQVEDDERKEKLQQAYESVTDHYRRILASV